MEDDGADMEDDEGDQDIGEQVVDAAQAVTERFVDQFEQGADEGDVVVGKQAAGDLHGQQENQGKNGKAAERIVAQAAPFAFEVNLDLGRRREELGEARVGRAGEAGRRWPGRSCRALRSDCRPVAH